MALFATPDFGASAGVASILMIVWAAVLAVVTAGVVWGVRLRKLATGRGRTIGAALIVTSASIPFACCLTPPVLIRLRYGNFPLVSEPGGKIRKGMSTDEVTAILGPPHNRVGPDDETTWYYWTDSYGIGYYGVHFGPDGRVTYGYGN